MAAEGPNADAPSSDQVDDIIQYPFFISLKFDIQMLTGLMNQNF